MSIEEALKFAEECKKNGNISTSAKAVIVLAEKIEVIKALVEEGASLGDFAYEASTWK